MRCWAPPLVLLFLLLGACGGSASRADFDAASDSDAVDVLFEVTPDTEESDDSTADTAPDAEADTAPEVTSDIAPEVEVTPVCEDCDDGLACTEDGCGIDGLCRNVVRSGFCAIGDRCVTAGFGSQCQVCAPNVDPTRYTPLTGGPCDDGDPCTIDEACMNGVCRGGLPITCPPPAPCEVALGCDKDTGCAVEPRPDGAVCGAGLVCIANETSPTPDCVANDPFAIGTLAFFDRASCPSGWVLASAMTGRTPVAGPPERVGETLGEPLSSGEDRRHTHAFTGTATTSEVSFAGIVGGGNGLSSTATFQLTGTDESASAGLPYLQLLACEKTAAPSPGHLPTGLMTFAGTSSSECPIGSLVEAAWGRLIVATPNGGTSGATFGRPTPPEGPTPPEATPHAHTLSGRIPTPAKGIALVSGCCGGGYASSGGLETTLSSTDTTVLFPTLSLLQCDLPPRVEASANEPDAAPPGMVLFASSASCPAGWSVHASSQGRLLVGAALGGDVGLAVQTPLTDREDRAHTHPVRVSATLSQRNIAAANGGNNNGAAPGTVSTTLPSAPATSGLAFVQRLACIKDTP